MVRMAAMMVFNSFGSRCRNRATSSSEFVFELQNQNPSYDSLYTCDVLYDDFRSDESKEHQTFSHTRHVIAQSVS